MNNVNVLFPHGLSPIGGVVNGLDQIKAHADKDNELPGRARVVISDPEVAVVTTYGGLHKGDKVAVVRVVGKTGLYLASGFTH